MHKKSILTHILNKKRPKIMLLIISFAILSLFFPQNKPPTDIMAYYNGEIKLSNDEAIQLVEYAIQSPSSDYEEVVALFLAGNLYENQNRNILSVSTSLLALEKMALLDTVDTYLLWGIPCNIGDALDNLRSYSEAIAYHKEALKHAAVLGRKKQALTYENIGNSYRDLLIADKTLENYTKALEIYQELGDQSRVAYMHYKFGLTYFKGDLFEEAIYYFTQSSYMSGSSNTVRGKSMNYLGMIAMDQKDYKKGYDYMIEGLKYLEGRWDYLTLLDMIEMSIKAEKISRADSLTTIAYTLYNQQSESKQDHSILSLHASILAHKQQYQQALALSKEYSDKTDYLEDKTQEANTASIAAYASIILRNHEQVNTIKRNNIKIIALYILALLLLMPVAYLLVKKYQRARKITAIASQIKTALS
jgi:tetratricopeptide (TPR) repeat protein